MIHNVKGKSTGRPVSATGGPERSPPVPETADIRRDFFQMNMHRRIVARLASEAGGVLSGIERARNLMELLGLLFESNMSDGDSFEPGREIARVIGNPVQVAQAEERIIGAVSKSSGIATAARHALSRAGLGCQVVCGGWKKMPLEIKDLVRQAVWDGGLHSRICEGDFIYLDKNYVRIMGGVEKAVRAANSLGRAVVVQVRGEFQPIGEEAVEAARMGASIVMVDTGHPEDLTRVLQALGDAGLRSRVKTAFAGNILLRDLDDLVGLDLDIIDIGYAILDAPCVPMRFDVIEVE